MKNVFIGFFLFIYLFAVNAQDKITLKNGKELIVYVIEKNDNVIKYKLVDSTKSNTVFSTKLANLKTINYENGIADLLSSQNPRSVYPLGISAGICLFTPGEEGGMYIGGIDYLITPKLSAEINLGFTGASNLYYSFGGKYWFADKHGKSRFSPFTGLLYGAQYGINFWEVPVGISYISKYGFQTSVQLSYSSYINALVDNEMGRLNVGFKIGWRFK